MAGLPEGWTDVVADDRELQANFVKVAVNVMTEPGQTVNVLPDVLRAWFGSDAGIPGRTDRVAFEVRDGKYRMRPASADEALPDGPPLWQTYTRDRAFKAVRIEPKGWDRQTGVVERPDQFVFFVTLDKTGREEAIQFKDRFISSTEFQWESQNRTKRDSDRGNRYLNQEKDSLPIHLFVRKQQKTGNKTSPFFYAGKLRFLRWESDNPIRIWWELEEPVPERLWGEMGIEGA